jgi:siroheme synthase-like protein
VDKPDLCNVIFPAVIERGDLTVALASDGTVPFFTRALKKDLDNTLPQDLNTKVELAKEFRRFVLDNCSKEEIKLKMYNLFLEKYEPDREIWERWLNEVSK